MKTKTIIFNILYFMALGFFITWVIGYSITSWKYWVQLIVLSILMNYHTDIHKKINNLNNKK